MSANHKLLSSVLLLALAGCGPKPPATKTSDDVDALIEPTPERNTPKASPLVSQAEALLAKGDARAAKAKFEEAIAADPVDARAQLGLGLSAEALGDLSGAERAYRKAIELDPKLAEAHNNLALVLRDKGDLEGALSALQQAAELAPQLATAQVNLALAYEDTGKATEARAAYERAVKLAPDDAMLRANYGLFLLGQNDAEGAERQLLTGVKSAKGDRAALLALGNGLRRANKPDVAVRALREAIAAGDGKPTPALLSELSLAQNAANDSAGARQSLEQALQLDGKYGTAHYLLGSLLAGQGNFKEATTHYKRCIELDPRSDLARKAKEKLEAAQRAAGQAKR